MTREERCGKRKRREDNPRKIPNLGYYYVVTDTQETEANYLYGLRDSLPKNTQGRLVIKVIKVSTDNLISSCKEGIAGESQYREPWIVLDRDKVPDFDEIIEEAKGAGINVGWSNPCIEIFFEGYFGKMGTYPGSKSCCQHFSEEFQKKTGLEYKKNNKKIYFLLNKYGEEATAIKIAEERLQWYFKNDEKKFSKMCPGTTLHRLVKEIKSKVNKR